MVRIASALFIICSVCYPLLIYLGIERIGPAALGFGLCLVALGKLLWQRESLSNSTLILLATTVVYSLIVAMSRSETLLRFYPVLISWVMALVFLLSVFDESSLIEQFARKMGQDITPNAKRYTRKLSVLWAVFLFINGGVACLLALFASLQLWTLYCGLISYLLIALLFVLELFYRRFYIAKYGA